MATTNDSTPVPAVGCPITILLQREIAQQKRKIVELEKENTNLRARIRSLEERPSEQSVKQPQLREELPNKMTATNESMPVPTVDCPISILLHSHFFLDSGLKIVNQEAAQHTQILAEKASRISDWWIHHRPLHMYYEGYHEGCGNDVSIREPATHDGPQAIREDSEDVLMVSLWEGQGSYNRLEESEATPALTSLKEDIERWWAKVEKKKKRFTHIKKKQRTANMHLPSGQLVDFKRAISTTHVRVSSALHVRAAVIFDYMKHHCLYHFLNTEDPDITWWICTTDDFDTYGEQEEDTHLNVYRNREACRNDRG